MFIILNSIDEFHRKNKVQIVKIKFKNNRKNTVVIINSNLQKTVVIPIKSA